MATLSKVDISSSWTLIYDAAVSGPFVGAVVCVSGEHPIYRIDTSLPAPGASGITTLSALDVQLSELAGEKLYARAYDGAATVVLDRAVGRGGWPLGMITDGQEEYGRLRVDVAQTGFFKGREFRTFKEISVASGATAVMRITVPVNTILQSVSLFLDAGSIKLRTVSGGTPTGTFTEAMPIIPKNTMTGGAFPAPPLPLYMAQNVVESGATALTGGVDIDVLRLVVANASGQASSVGAAIDDSRGVGPGAYYWVFNNFGTGTATGVFSSFWEERP